jgi:hypothetical protein
LRIENKKYLDLKKALRWTLLFSILHSSFSIANAAAFEFDLYYGVGAPDFSFVNAPIAISVYPWKYFGFSTGLEYSMRKKDKEYSNVENSLEITENHGLEEGTSFIFEYQIEKYKEELSTQILQVPLMLKFRSKWFYASTGIKLGIPQNIKSKISYEGLETRGCLPELSACIENVDELKFTTYSGSLETKITSKTLLMLAAESGLRIQFSKNFALLLGAFADYSLNKGFERGQYKMVDWEYLDDEAVLSISDGFRSWKPWSAGGAVKLSFGFGSL